LSSPFYVFDCKHYYFYALFWYKFHISNIWVFLRVIDERPYWPFFKWAYNERGFIGRSLTVLKCVLRNLMFFFVIQADNLSCVVANELILLNVSRSEYTPTILFSSISNCNRRNVLQSFIHTKQFWILFRQSFYVAVIRRIKDEVPSKCVLSC